MLDSLLLLLAVLGVLALLARLVRSLLRLGLAAAEATAVAGLIEVSARRGDLTGLAERQAQEKRVHRVRLRSALRVLLWAGVLVVPALVGWGREVYAFASLLWLVPRREARPLTPPADSTG